MWNEEYVVMVSLAQVVYPGLFPLSPGDTLAASEASQKPSVRLEEASKDKLYTVGWFTLQFFIYSQIFPSHGRPRCAIQEKPSGCSVAPLDNYQC